MAGAIELRQTNPKTRADLHAVTNPTISSLSVGAFLQQVPLTASIREYLFELRKDGITYWVGAAVPEKTTDFSKAQVFFHPTVVNGGVVHAADSDYPTFTGGWSGSLQRYVAMQGGQWAGVSRTMLIVPFMTMASLSGKSPHYMFATRPTETLEAIFSAVHKAATGNATPVSVTKIGVSSFSSGIGAMRLFIATFGTTGQIVEVTDYDSAFIKKSARTITTAPGAIGRVISQNPPTRPSRNWITLPAWKFKHITAFRDKGVHAQIGWMTFSLGGLMSSIK